MTDTDGDTPQVEGETEQANLEAAVAQATERQQAEIEASGLNVEKETKKSARARKADSDEGPVWLEWVGGSKDHTPPLPTESLTEPWVRYYLSSMEEIDGLVKTGMWKSHVPDGALPKTVKKPTGG